jgi:transcriptional regulator with GAF, ATPase, and Fis domain
MVVVPPRARLATLADELRRLVPVASFGFVESVDDEQVSIIHAHAHGLTRWILPASDLPDLLRPEAEGLHQAGTASLDDLAYGSVRGFLPTDGARRLVSIGIADRGRATRFWFASPRAEVLSVDETSRLRAIVSSAAHLLDTPPQPDALIDGVRGLAQVGELMPSLLRTLDPSEVFDLVSSAARRALPHDLALLHLFPDDETEARTFTGSGDPANAAPEVSQAYPPVITRFCDVAIVDDHRAHAPETGQMSTSLPVRSSLRFAVRFDGRVLGELGFFSLEPNRFTSTDIAIGRRLADHVSVALAHHRLASDRRRAAALQQRADNLEALDGLLATLTGVLDVREVFDRVSAIAQKVLPHDAMSISELIENGAKVRIHASHGLGDLPEPFDLVIPDSTMASELWDYRLIDDVYDHPEYATGPGWAAGMRSMLFVSFRMEERNYGGLNFYSKTVGRFVREDVVVARRITAHVALAISHRRLAEEARKGEELRARTASLELLDALLRTIADTGDVRGMLATVSETVRRVLAHDGAVLMARPPEEVDARVYTSKAFPAPLPESMQIPDNLCGVDWDHTIVDDLTRERSLVHAQLSRAGFRSLVWVPLRMDGHIAGALALLATTGRAFTPPDMTVVRRMADRLTVTLARDREIAASQRADDAAARAARLEARVKSLTEELDARTGYRRVVGESREWRQVLTQAAQVAVTETTVLLLGESGTGKEVIARFLHRGSTRKSGPFIALNCAALPEQLLEAELFGYERGAFTGATQSKPGQLEQAAGGTLFLDEVGEMSPSAQAKFLRVLQEREFQRLGGTRVLRTDARVIAATNRDLLRAIANGQFREDLYYRLNVFAIRLPPLRDRRDDILPLSEAFIAEIGRGLGRPPAGISRDAREALLGYAWPGNIRELRNVLERAAILCDGGLITGDYLAITATPHSPRPSPPPEPTGAPAAFAPPFAAPDPEPANDDLQAMERAMIERALQNAKFNKSKAANALGLTRHQLYIRLRKHGFE